MNTKEIKIILNLASDSIRSKFEGKELKIDESKLPDILKEERACFVTLTIEGELRGCIGHLLPTQPLYLDIIENARGAAFRDSRFNPLSEAEFEKIKIEVSVLDIPHHLEYKSVAELIKFLQENKPGVIIKKGGYSATFLPAVWEELTQPEDFLSHLCTKAGLHEGEWKGGELEVEVYGVVKFIKL